MKKIINISLCLLLIMSGGVMAFVNKPEKEITIQELRDIVERNGAEFIDLSNKETSAPPAFKFDTVEEFEAFFSEAMAQIDENNAIIEKIMNGEEITEEERAKVYPEDNQMHKQELKDLELSETKGLDYRLVLYQKQPQSEDLIKYFLNEFENDPSKVCHPTNF